MGVVIENNQDIIDLTDDFLKNIAKVAEEALKLENVNVDYEIFISLVDNDEIKKINFEHRGINRETDCLSFPMLNYSKGKVFREQYSNFKFEKFDLEDGKLILGDVIVSLEKAKSQSMEFGHSFEREVFYLVIHSLLHLLGYDHLENEDKIFMREAEKNIVRKLGIYR